MKLIFIRHENLDGEFDLYIDKDTLEIFRFNILSGMVEVFLFAGVWQTTDMTDDFVKQFQPTIDNNGIIITEGRSPTVDEMVELKLLHKIKASRSIIMRRARENND